MKKSLSAILMTVCLLFALTACSAPEPVIERPENTAQPVSESICIMSYNLRVADINGEYGDRRVRVAETVYHEMPDSFGVQEATPEWLEALDVRLEQYDYVGIGREADGTGESSAVFYRTDKYKLLASETKWLSATPDVMGSMFDGENYIRIMTYAVLQSRTTGLVYVHANTHLSLKDDVRMWQVEVLRSVIAEYSARYPTFITGDFNDASADNAAYYLTRHGFTDSRTDANISDSHDTFPSPLYPKDGTAQSRIIDYCLHNGMGVSVDTYRVITTPSSDGGWSSDHYPIVIRGNIRLPDACGKDFEDKITAISAGDNYTLCWGQSFADNKFTVFATLENGKKIAIPDYLWESAPDIGIADMGTYRFDVKLKADSAITCTKSVTVNAIFQAENAILDNGAVLGKNRTDQIEYIKDGRGKLVDSGRRVTYVGGLDNAVANDKTPTVTFKITAIAGNYRLSLRCASTWWNKANDGSYSTDISKVLRLKVNGNAVTVKAAVIPALSGTYINIGRTFFTLDMADITLKDGENTIVIEGCCNGYDYKNVQYWDEAPVPNIDYIEILK